MERIELLAPVGTQDNLIAAVNAGANAVYLAGKHFGARRSALNFDRQALKEAVAYCHLYNVSVYVTVNTLIKTEELTPLYEWIDYLYAIDVDAIIVQDMAVLDYCQRHYPDLDCHASTQMTCHSLKDVEMAASLGFKRVVLGRELSFEEIRLIHDRTKVELEFFVHGALCISYSGQCLLSSSVGGRSGNRGACAQPCRKKYTLAKQVANDIVDLEASGYLMSPKDVNTIDRIKEIKDLDRISLKIEGRMKNVDYVFAVVNAYRQAIDDLDFNSVRLDKVFNRHYSSGHIGGATSKELMNYDSPSHYGTLLGKVLSYEEGMLTISLMDDLNKGDELQIRRHQSSIGTRADQIYKGHQMVKSAEKGDVIKVPFKHPVKRHQMVYKTYDVAFIKAMNQEATISLPVHGIDFELDLIIGQAAVLKARSNDITIKVDSGEHLVETATHKPLDQERIIEQFNKLGGTAFYMANIKVNIGENATLKVSVLNQLRRQAISIFESQFALWHPERQVQRGLKSDDIKEGVVRNESGQSEPLNQGFDIIIGQIDQAKFINCGLNDRLFLDNTREYRQNLDDCIKRKIYLKLPAIIRDDEMNQIDKLVMAYHSKGGDTIMLAHLGQLKYASDFKHVVLDLTFNILNKGALSYYSQFAETLYLSQEIDLHSIVKSAYKPLSVGVSVYGRLVAMTSEYCVVGGALYGHDKCGACLKDSFYLKNDKGEYLPLICDMTHCRMQILTQEPINEFDKIDHLKAIGISRFRIDFRGEGQTKNLETFSRNHSIKTKEPLRSYLDKGIE